jgi:Nif-specific regulatory protein
MQNMVERMVILAEDNHLTLDDVPSNLLTFKQPVDFPDNQPLINRDDHQEKVQPKELQEVEREQIEAALRRNGWVQVRAAKELGLTQRQIGYRIKKYGLSRYDSFKIH